MGWARTTWDGFWGVDVTLNYLGCFLGWGGVGVFYLVRFLECGGRVLPGTVSGVGCASPVVCVITGIAVRPGTRRFFCFAI